ncbi:HAD-IIIA family hydrolase [candidate division KSB3 bacterium]|uniref:D,D-heptose 1,7-bisphosphate phosphatase n=1 Tax=candidate division KSB3 bacterium TaxID=2044937 RepID=A0A9D5JXT6_9BACT|nr:HAD-IIIA family hydrolase [candidate division KSB3 bacterium]MBD3326075.1 HAD-IIIA family hydrolase [candidate division KSB3 bacterium]
MNTAIFLDRDGVIIEDTHLLTKPTEISIPEGVPQALQRMKAAGFRLIVVSNQAVVARGMLSEHGVERINAKIASLLEKAGGPQLDGSYFCPHHPNSTLAAYRVNCKCRKPQPGLLLRAAQDHNVHLTASFMIGDRITDIVAGAKAHCRTILIQTGKHLAPPIETVEPLDETIQPDYICADLGMAVKWILDQTP